MEIFLTAYDDFYVAAKTEVEEQVQGTEEFVETISNYLSIH
jgi:hypothetical protein